MGLKSRKLKTSRSVIKVRRTQRRQDVPQPSKELVEHYLKKWDKLEDYASQEEAVIEFLEIIIQTTN